MDAPPSIARLAVGGLTLDPRAFRAQRDHPAGTRRGLLFVLGVSLLVSVAGLIGNLGAYFTQPDPQAVAETIRDGVAAMPFYRSLATDAPELAVALDELLAQPGALSLTAAPQQSLLALLVGPLLSAVSWFIGGSVVHIAARAFGGVGRYGQTLATVALASSANLLGLVQVVPYAQQLPFALLIASGLLGMLASYVAVRETHGLAPWRAFWAVLIGPLLLTVLVVGLYCCVVLLGVAAASGLQGAAR